MWYAIATPYGVVLKFDSVAECREVARRLEGMANWAEQQIVEGGTAKLSFATFPDDLGQENRAKLNTLTDNLPDAILAGG